jgi:hypothetical protein
LEGGWNGGNGYRGLVLYCTLIVFTFTIGTKSIDAKTVTLQILIMFVSKKKKRKESKREIKEEKRKNES